MAGEDCDLFVIGGGSGGVRAARMAAQAGARVMLAEAAALGGTCVNVGCIPKKLYGYAAQFSTDCADAAGFGWDVAACSFDWERLKANRAAEIARLRGVYEHLLRSAGVELLAGWARLTGAQEVEVQTAAGERRVRARHVLVATGSTPAAPPLAGSELLVSSDQMFDLDPFPRRLVVIGGGYIACEFASIFRGLGAHVVQIHRSEQVLRGFDDDVRHCIARELRGHGIDLRLRCQARAVTRQGGQLAVTLAGGEVLLADAVLHATGRSPNVAGLGLEAVGVALDERGAIQVDERCRTSVASIHAIGDVTGRVQLTPVALAEAMVVVDDLFGTGGRRLDYELVPTAVFTHPHIACVGLTEAQARERYDGVTIFRSEFRPLKHTLSGSASRMLVKLVVDTATDRVVGLHMVGAEAGEVVQGFAVAMRAGATKAVFDATLGIHPTAAEEFVTLREPVAGQAPPVLASR